METMSGGGNIFIEWGIARIRGEEFAPSGTLNFTQREILMTEISLPCDFCDVLLSFCRSQNLGGRDRNFVMEPRFRGARLKRPALFASEENFPP